MSSKAIKWVGFAVAAIVVAVALLLLCSQEKSGDAVRSQQGEGEPLVQVAKTQKGVRSPASVKTEDSGSDEAENEPDAPDESEEPKSEDELSEEEDEKKVEAFDEIVDKWMEKEGGEVTMKDMDDFVALFRSVPAARKEECLHRALNLVSDDHVLLLAGILFDKMADKDHVELVFNDVLNRDESVKKLILPMIYKDKTHPCWADTAWILDVTGETPNQTKEKPE